MRNILAISAFLFSLSLAAQKDHLSHRIAPIPPEVFGSKSSKHIGEQASADLQSQVALYAGFPGEYHMKLTDSIGSNAFTHYHYQLYLNDTEIFGAKVHAVVQKNGILKRIQYTELPATEDLSAGFPSDRSAPLKGSYKAEDILESKKVYVLTGEKLIPARYLELAVPNGMHEILVYTDDGVLYNSSLVKHYHSTSIAGMRSMGGGPNDTVAYGFVFDPDPLTSAMVNYGYPYIDAGDSGIAELNAQRKIKTLLMTYENGNFLPKNDFVEIGDVSPPAIPPVSGTNDQFYFSRSEPGFEDINVLYHITQHKLHMDSLGFSGLPGYAILADTHAKGGEDNSEFRSDEIPYRLLFGEGGVDDAEDADVIIHEYMHAYVLAATANNFGSNERNTIEEALCDYFAASYSLTVNDFNKKDVFNWDGHNEFWSGREVESTKDYLQVSFGSNIYQHTDLFASPLMEIYSFSGRETTDKLVMEAIYNLGQTTTMKEMADHIIEADSALYGGAHYYTIVHAFIRRNILDDSYLGNTNFQVFSPDLKLYNTMEFARGGQLYTKTDNIVVERYEIYNMSGQLLRREDTGDRHERIHISSEGLKPGIYLIGFFTKQGDKVVHRVLRY